MLRDCIVLVEDLFSGGKRSQPSTTVRDENKVSTAIRNARLQRDFDELAANYPRLNKEQVAEKVAKLPAFKGMSAQTIARNVRKAKNSQAEKDHLIA